MTYTVITKTHHINCQLFITTVRIVGDYDNRSCKAGNGNLTYKHMTCLRTTTFFMDGGV